MNLTALQTRVLERLDDTGGVYYLTSEVTAALNKAQRLFCFLTHCLERTATFDLTAGQFAYNLKDDADFATFLLPLRVTCDGRRVQPKTIHQLDTRNSRWRLKRGTPTDYAMLGFDSLFIYPTPDAPGASLVITAACEPVALVSGSDVPEIPEEDHPALPRFARYYLRAKEGGVEFQNTLEDLKIFLEAIGQRAESQRAQGMAQRFDRITTFDLKSADLSNLYRMKLDKLPPLKVMEAKT